MSADDEVMLEALAETGHTWSESEMILQTLHRKDQQMIHASVFEDIAHGDLNLAPGDDQDGQDLS